MNTAAEQLAAEIARYEGHLQMALREVEAGNERMRPYAEAYAQHMGSLRLRDAYTHAFGNADTIAEARANRIARRTIMYAAAGEQRP